MRGLQVLVRALSTVCGRISGQTRLHKQLTQTRDSVAHISGTLKVWHGFRTGWIQQLARNLSRFSTCWLHFALSISLSLHHGDVGRPSSGPASSLLVFSVRTSGLPVTKEQKSKEALLSSHTPPKHQSREVLRSKEQERTYHGQVWEVTAEAVVGEWLSRPEEGRFQIPQPATEGTSTSGTGDEGKGDRNEEDSAKTV